MAVKFETVKHEEAMAQTHRVLGKIVSSADKHIIQDVLATLLKGGKEGTPRIVDLLRIAGVIDVDIPQNWRLVQEMILKADAELEAKQRLSASESREAGAKKRRLRKEQEERDAAERELFEHWKRLRNTRSAHDDGAEDRPES